MKTDAIPYALGAIGLGVVGAMFGDFALQWQPVPQGIPARQVLAWVSALLLVLGGAAVLAPPVRRWGGLLLGVHFGAWVFLLHGPEVLGDPAEVAVWNGFAELLAISCGGLMIFLSSDPEGGRNRRLIQVTRLAFGLCPIVFGLAHMKYAEFTASMVPGWIPGQLFWAYATGFAHLAAGLAILSGVLSRLAATLLATMCGSFVLILCLPRVVANPASHVEWTMLVISVLIASSAWMIRSSLARDGETDVLSFVRRRLVKA